MPLSPSFPEEKGEPSVKPKRKDVLNGYCGVLWQQNHVVWIALEPWLSACLLHAPDKCKVWLASNELEEATHITIWLLFLHLCGVGYEYYTYIILLIHQ